MTFVIMAGCAGSGAVPRADAAMAVRSHEDLAILEHGRRIYVTSCTGCHALYRVDALDEDAWRETVAVMAPKARLTANDRDVLLRYLRAASR